MSQSKPKRITNKTDTGGDGGTMGPPSLSEAGSGYTNDTVGELGLWHQYPNDEGGFLSIEQGVDSGLYQYVQNAEGAWTFIDQAGTEYASLLIPLGPDFGAPSYLVVNADGTVGAAFTGKVTAQGLQLAAGAGATPPTERRVQWVDTLNEVVGDLFTYLGLYLIGRGVTGGTSGDLVAEAISQNGLRRAGIRAQSGANGGAAVQSQVLVRADVVGDKKLLAGDGTSDFSLAGAQILNETNFGPNVGVGSGRDLRTNNFTVPRPGLVMFSWGVTCYSNAAAQFIYNDLYFSGAFQTRSGIMADVANVRHFLSGTWFKYFAAGTYSYTLASLGVNHVTDANDRGFMQIALVG